MNKEEILKKAQSKKPNQLDEREQHIECFAYEVAFFVGLLVCVLLMVIKMFAGLPWQDLYSVFMFMLGIRDIYKGIKLESKYPLVQGSIWCILGLLLLLTYCSKIF